MRKRIYSFGIEDVPGDLAILLSVDDRLASINANLKRIADALDRQG